MGSFSYYFVFCSIDFRWRFVPTVEVKIGNGSSVLIGTAVSFIKGRDAENTSESIVILQMILAWRSSKRKPATKKSLIDERSIRDLSFDERLAKFPIIIGDAAMLEAVRSVLQLDSCKSGDWLVVAAE